MDIFNIKVMFGTELIKVDHCDIDHISLITLIHATIKELSGRDEVPTEDCLVWIHLRWSGGYQALGWCDIEAKMLNYNGDSEKDDDKDCEDGEDGEGEGRQGNKGHNMQYFEDGEGEGRQAYEGHNSDSELEPKQVRIAKLMKSVPFKKMRSGEIKFEVDYKCKENGCPWRAHGSRLPDGITFKLKTLVDSHECHRIYNNKEAKVSWIAFKFENLVKRNPSICVKVISDLLREKYKVSVDIQRLYKAKKRALERLAKDHAQSFGKLRRYDYTVNQSFLDGCRLFIEVDGCHLKGPYGGVLLSAVALDANNGLFSLVVYICEKETQFNCEWFLSNLKIHVKFPSGRNLTFMSDRQKGVIQALQKHFPCANKRCCARHIYANFRITYKGDHFKKLFWRASRSSNVFDFKETLDEIGAINPDAKSWLQEIEPKHWSRHAYDQVIRCDHVTNNMTEAFNSMLGTHRAFSYLDLLEFIRRMVMRKFQERKKECEQWNSVLPPKVNAKILKNGKESRMLTIITARNKEYEILDPNEGYAINLDEYSCQCGGWKVSGIPCRHAMAAISHHCSKSEVKEIVNEYVHQSLTKSAYLQTYQGMIHPIPDQKRWPEVHHCLLIEGQTEHIDPPPRTVQPGRPKIQKKREPNEGSKGGKFGTVTCKLCNQVGHNKISCKSKKNKLRSVAAIQTESIHCCRDSHQLRIDSLAAVIQTQSRINRRRDSDPAPNQSRRRNANRSLFFLDHRRGEGS
ncbi:hypothetical protein EZV62_023515 [Acer yangbiense]|uniref:SWIM-type domain-containing protein n=1 Tax=Acer yangbiense TaxID=1000413 RepID=A0A5C7H2A1_9ROSI|nr:hypothetical protein EZV62_023515 [Acer yangbiense]